MDAVQVWQREEHAGHVAMLVGIVRWGGIYDLQWAYAVVARGPLGTEGRTLVVLGEKDMVFGGDAVKKELERVGWNMADGIEVMEDAGHLVVREKPIETAEVLGRFWGRCEG
jgi:pimeloyl-ACP methyl ester carboxylesterase